MASGDGRRGCCSGSVRLRSSLRARSAKRSEISALARGCDFRDCSHTHEPRCAVKAALDAGVLDPVAHGRYAQLARSGRVLGPVSWLEGAPRAQRRDAANPLPTRGPKPCADGADCDYR